MKHYKNWLQNVILACGLSWTGGIQAQSINGLLREVYADIPGTALSDLTNSPAYPGSPSSENLVTDGFESPTDVAENYGQRLRGLLVPPTTGNYTFWIATDDAGGLYLSTDDSPANIRPIAWVNAWAPPRAWTVEPNQKSAALRLEAGKQYYVEALMKEGGGGDNLAVRWQLPDGTIEEPIPASRLLVYGLGPPAITQAPRNVTTIEGGQAVFDVQVNRATGASFQWQRNGVNIAGATNMSLEIGPVALAESGARFRCGVTNSQGGVLSLEAVLSVTPDATPPTVEAAMSLGDRNSIAVLFSEAVEAATALEAANYAVDHGVTVLSAQFAGDSRTVLLKTTPLNTGATYALTVNRVRDRATTPNVIAADTFFAFRLEIKPLDVAAILGSPEPLGPSNRRWGVVISEVMYHPAAREDGRDARYLELFNTFDWPEDISGWRLSGAIDYVFPANTILPKRGFLVVAPVAEEVQTIYQITGVAGGLPKSLPKDKGLLRLRNANDTVIFEMEYSSQEPYPAAAAGAGHALVLARPSYGEGHPEAWGASERIGGSPGALEPAPGAAYRTVLINEVLAHTAAPQVDFVELYNYSTQAVNLAGCVITDDPATNKYVIPEGAVIPGMGFAVFDRNLMGFGLSSGGESVWLFNPERTRVIDGIRCGAQENGVSSGRYPDGAPEFRALNGPTPGAENSGWLPQEIVINELMYKPISRDSQDEYVELYNQGTTAADLSQWRFVEGIDFTFPPGTTIPAGGYLVVAKNQARLRSNYAHLNAENTVGDYAGTLANRGERLALAKPSPVLATNDSGRISTNWVNVTVAKVAWRKGGRWPHWANGGGSSMELIDPRADTHRASNWADSDESAKSQWTTIESTGVLDNGGGSFALNQLQVFLLGAGECLIDDVEVFKPGGNNLVSNPAFANGLAGWVPQGNHKISFLQSNGGVAQDACLRVRTTGRGDTGANRIRTVVNGLSAGNTATLRAKVRWLKGWPEILLRLRGNWLETAGTLNVPRNLGTPGLPNSRRVANAGPAIFDVTHSPVLPAAGKPVTVRARVDDADGLSSLVLYYRQDPATNFTAIGMTYNGAGYYSATIPGRPAKTQVAFYLQATDMNPAPALARFPNDAPQRECLVEFGETIPAGNFGTYRLWLTDQTVKTWSSREKLNNAPLDGTFVYGDFRVIYNMGALYAGSPFLSPGYNSPVGGLCGYVFNFPEDDLCLNTTDFTLDWPIRDGTGQLEHIAMWMIDQIGAHGGYRRFVNLYVNGNRRGTIYEDCLQPNGDVAKALYPDDADGDLYKIDDWFEFDDAGAGFSNIDATLQKFTTTGNALKTARYRWNWRKRAVVRSANDYTTLLNLVNTLNPKDPSKFTEKETAAILDLADVRQWFRVMAIEHIVVNWDSYGFNRGKNMLAYKPQKGKWIMLPWDIDFLFDAGGGNTSTDLFTAGDPTIRQLWNQPIFRRLYLQALQDAAEGPMTQGKLWPIMDARYAGLTANGISVSPPVSSKSWISKRRDFVLQQVNAYARNFAITSNNGRNFNTNASLVALSGTAPLGVRAITLNGIDYPLTWSSVTNWTAKIALAPGMNTLLVQAYDRQGNAYPGGQATMGIQYTGAAEDPADWLAINEIMYHPAVPDASFVELFNRSAATSYDLSRWQLKGVDFIFPDGTILGPQGYAVVAENKAVFASAYGANVPVVGEYAGKLDHGGEGVSLVKPGATSAEDVVIDRVNYQDRAPWPTAADGFGPSLQLIDAAQDHQRTGNWTAAATNDIVRYTPGAPNSTRATLAPFPDLWINEVMPENLNGAADAAGEHDPWIELYNRGTSAVDLGGLYLSPDATNLMVWQFPAGATLPAGQFLVVWADGQPEQSGAGAWHTGFRLSPGTGSIVLSRPQNGSPAVIDYLHYRWLAAGRSFGPYPDGQAKGQQLFPYPTPGGANNPASMPVNVRINEWMANNTRTLLDPLTQKYDDWFELYNAGSTPVDLTDYTLTDTLTNATPFVIPAGTAIPAGGCLLVWADQKANNPTNQELHVNFKLSQTGEAIGLFAPDGTVVDTVVFGPQTNDVSQGRYPDGAAEPFIVMDSPTPGTPNFTGTGNRPPRVDPLPRQLVFEGDTLAVTVTATDPDAGQIVTFGLAAGAPAGAVMQPNSGVFTWTPSAEQIPGVYWVTATATDNGEPPRSGTATFRVDTAKVNHPPVWTAPGDQVAVEETPFRLALSAADPDAGQHLSFGIVSGAPAGATLDAASGVLSWTPAENQGPGEFAVTVRVSDDGIPSLSATQSLWMMVLESNRAPVLAAIADQTVTVGTALVLTLSASDADLPANTLTYRFEGAVPSGMTLEPDSGRISWTPVEAQAPATNQVTVSVSDHGTPSLSATQSFTVVAKEPSIWQYVSVTGTASSSSFYIYLTSPGDVYLDDLQIVAGQTAATGPNLLPNGDFEKPLTNPWTVSANHAGSTLVTNVVHSGKSSLHLVATSGGTTRASSIWQDISPALSANADCTLSFWYLPGSNASTLVLRLSGYGISSTNAIVPGVNHAPSLAAIDDQTVNAGSQLSFTVAAKDADLPAQKLTFSLAPGAPAGATITAAGGFSWTPSAAQGPGVYPITVKVTDNGQPALSAARLFRVAVTEPSPWRYVATTGTATASAFYLYLTARGDAYLDDIKLVAGTTAEAGANLLANGDFEEPLTNAWTIAPNHSGSALATHQAHAGNASLHLAASSGGSSKDSSIWQELSPALTQGADYTLSYWYLPGASSNTLVLRLSGSGISSTNAMVPPPQPAAVEIAGISKETGDRFTVTWVAAPGARYRLQAIAQLPGTAWDNVGEIVTATSGTATQSDPGGNGRQKFYRILKLD